MIGCAGYVLEADEFDTVGIAGEPQSAASHEKLRSKENVKRKTEKNKTVANTRYAPSSLVFFLAKKQKKTVNKEALRKRGSAFISAPFPLPPPRVRSQGQEETHI